MCETVDGCDAQAADTITYTLNDNGNTGRGGALEATGTVAVTLS
eukprot:CAMPEP_0118877254 /NCGR_PEP_ID=MMETSP1163-20130328/17617_1 /TAXON_ID=124430 /ORGANISM="Phaeomonas parva, Strain CCMP2877" /LENGTH=43 /DNA_ID= /DNA_START= /DNA_END= /DNA_ORIENTATION=